MTSDLTLRDIKPLSNQQYDNCRDAAISRVKNKIGQRPERQHYTRQLESLWGPLDAVALILGLSAWLVSSLHILAHAGRAAAASYSATIANVDLAGFAIDRATYGRVHQLGMITLAESAMILFMIMHTSRQRRPQRPHESAPAYALRTGASIALLLALGAATFTLYANLQSGVGLLESVLPPAVTIGLGIYFERILSEWIRRRKETTARYLGDLVIWENAQVDIETHPDYTPFFRQEIAQYLMRLKPQRDYEHVPLGLVKAAVLREMQRDRWAYAATLESEYTAAGSFTPAAAGDMTAIYTAPSANGNGRSVPAAPGYRA